MERVDHRSLIRTLAIAGTILGLHTLASAQCGTTVYDTGGTGGNYANNQNYSVTYCPSVAGQVVTLTFSQFSTENGYDFLTVYNGSTTASPSLGTFSGTTIPGPFTSTDASGCLTIRFISDGSLTYAGWTAAISCGAPPPPPVVCGTTVYDPGGPGGNYGNSALYTQTYCPTTAGQVVTLTFTAFSTEANYDYLTVYNGPTTASPVMGTFSGATIPGPFISTDPSGCITIRFTSDGSINYPGWAINITCSTPSPPLLVCGTTVYDPGGATGDYANSTSYTVTYCPSVAGQVVTLNFSQFATEAGVDNLTIYNGPTTASPAIGSYSGTTNPGTITSTAPGGCLTLRFISNGTNVAAGWAAAVTCALPPPSGSCGSLVYDPGGAGGNYANSTNWTATYCPTNPGDVVTLNFSQFDIENGYDVLYIHNGSTTGEPILGQYTGTGSPGSVTSTAPNGCLTLHFVSDGSITYPGWAASISCGPPPPPPNYCGTNVYDPGGPTGYYANNTTWTQTYCPTVPGEVVRINFIAFNTEAGFDFLTIYNGPSTASPILGTFSGTGNPGTIISSAPGGCLTLQLTSDGSINAPGWSAGITCIVPPPPPTGDCIYVLTLNDSFGDGWGTSRVGVSINGGPVQYYGATGSFFQVVFGVNINDLVTLTYVNTGPNQTQNSYSLSIQGQGSPLFTSGSPPAAGLQYAGLVDCVPPATPPQDCIGGITICSGQAFNNNSNNTGTVVDLTSSNQGCLNAGERQGTWYYFSPSAGGTIGFTITPTAPTDYDFAVWGPMAGVTCPPPGPPLRCSWAAPYGPTGCGNGATDVSEGAGGDRFVSTFNVNTGDVYLLYVDNFSTNGQSFNLDWNLTNGASLDCTVLPVELIDFKAVLRGSTVDVTWTTQTETGTDRFVVEHSLDGNAFREIGSLAAAGHSVARIDYHLPHPDPAQGTNYYRLQRWDEDGSSTYGNVVTVQVQVEDALNIRPNPATSSVRFDLPSGLDGNFSVVMIDGSGRTVKRRPVRSVQGDSFVDISLEDVDAGSYLIRLQDASGLVLASGRFMKY